MSSPTRPHWRLPSGVTRGLWDYVHSPHIARDYDDYFSENRLFGFDEQVVLRELETCGLAPDALVADLGCGSGRMVIALARRGYRGLAVDLSPWMLSVVRNKARRERLPIECLCANLVELECLSDGCVSAALCLFSTLGMIRGRKHRQTCLNHIRRILRPGGPFVLHVHNYWYNLYDPPGPWWLAQNMAWSLVSKEVERGDKFFDYRGVPNMFLHVFTLGELRRTLAAAGFRITELIPLDPRRHRRLKWPRLAGSLRANGWIAVCT